MTVSSIIYQIRFLLNLTFLIKILPQIQFFYSLKNAKIFCKMFS